MQGHPSYSPPAIPAGLPASHSYVVGPHSSPSPAALTEAEMFLSPIFVPARTPVDQVIFEVTIAGAAGSLVRLGLFDNDPARFVPRSLLYDFGTVDTSTTGVKTLAIAATLPTIAWLATAQQGAAASSATVRTWNSPAGYVLNPEFVALTNTRTSYSVAGVTGALPASVAYPITSTTFKALTALFRAK